MKTAYQKISALAHELTPEELNEAIKLFKKLGGVKGDKEKSFHNEYAGMNRLDSLFHSKLFEYLLAATGTRIVKLEILKNANNSLFMKIVDVRETIDEHFKNWIPKKYRKDSRAKFYSLYFEVMGDHIINNTRRSLSIKTMVQFIDDFPGVLDRAFPGYIRSGLLYLVLKDKK